MAKILMVGAFDTIGPEYAFLRDQIIARGHEVLAMNTGVIGAAEAFAVDFGADEVAAAGGSSLEALRDLSPSPPKNSRKIYRFCKWRALSLNRSRKE